MKCVIKKVQCMKWISITSINSHVLHYSYTMHQNGKKNRFYICNLKHTFEINMPFFLYFVSFTQSKQHMNTLQLESLCLHSISKMLSFHKIREIPCRTYIKTELSYLSGMSTINCWSKPFKNNQKSSVKNSIKSDHLKKFIQSYVNKVYPIRSCL